MKLRRKTGYSFVNCKKALETCGGDLKQVGGGAARPGAAFILFFRGCSGDRRCDLRPSVLNDRAKAKNLA